MSKRPRRNRPPRLPDHGPLFPTEDDEPRPGAPRPLTPRAALVGAHVAGEHPQLGRAEVRHTVERLAAGAPDAGFGLDLGPVGRDEATDAIAATWGWELDTARAAIDPDLTLEAADAAAARIAAVAEVGGRIAVATGRPAALLPLSRAVATAAAGAGAEVLACAAFDVDGHRGHQLWWHDGVAVLSDGASLLADDAVTTADDWLFAVGRPQLAIADHGFAAAAAGAGVETIALADLDSVALAVAAGRGLPLHLVPLCDSCPPSAYEVVVDRLTAFSAPHPAPSAHQPHSTTRAPDAYAAPQSGGEG